MALCCATPSQCPAPASTWLTWWDWMGLTWGARVASPKEGADTSTVTSRCHLLLTSTCSATQKSVQSCLLCVHIPCWPQAEEASVSWSDAILCQGSGMLLLLALRKPNCNSCAALTLLFCLFSLLFCLCCARHEEMAWGSSCYRK